MFKQLYGRLYALRPVTVSIGLTRAGVMSEIHGNLGKFTANPASRKAIVKTLKPSLNEQNLPMSSVFCTLCLFSKFAAGLMPVQSSDGSDVQDEG